MSCACEEFLVNLNMLIQIQQPGGNVACSDWRASATEDGVFQSLGSIVS